MIQRRAEQAAGFSRGRFSQETCGLFGACFFQRASTALVADTDMEGDRLLDWRVSKLEDCRHTGTIEQHCIEHYRAGLHFALDALKGQK